MLIEFSGKINCRSDGTICILDDSEIDLFMARRCFSKSRLKDKFEWCEFNDPQAFLEYLQQFIGQEKSTYPCLVLLDINMPGKSGLDVLKEVRTIADFSEIPFLIMLTNSQNKDDMDKARMNGADGYQVKPFLQAEYVAFFDSLQTPA